MGNMFALVNYGLGTESKTFFSSSNIPKWFSGQAITKNCSRYVISWDEGVPVGNVKPGIGRVIAVVAHHKVLSFGYRHLKGNV